jgi:tRNA dimethylallyltransferase
MSRRLSLVAVVGPTASGKSALGVHLAERLNGEVIVCDSTQVYRGFDLGTGKLRPADRRGVPHHLLDLLEPREVFTAGEYRRRAIDLLGQLAGRGKLPIFTVGTGLYLRALVEGLADAPTRSDELRARLRARAERRGRDDLHRVLARLDPEAAARIAPRDLPKVIRAIEVRVLSGRPLTELHRAVRPALEGYEILKVGLVPPRNALYQRINARVEAMLAAGWAGEVRGLIAAGIPRDAKPFQFIGYRQLRDHLEGRLGQGEMMAKIQQATRRYAKRQLTWFRREPGVRWFSGFGDDPGIAAAVLAELAPKLAARAGSSRAV